MTNQAKIKEIFTSIQGEGPYIGVKQLFIRFCGCNLACKYCDTEFSAENGRIYTTDELIKIANDNTDCHSVALTGGEPLLQADFLKEFLPLCKLPVYLETNATLANELKKVIDYVDYVSADIKLPSCTGGKPHWTEHEEFFSVAGKKELFAKIVFDEKITDDEIEKSVKLASKYGIILVLQPKFNGDKVSIKADLMREITEKFISRYKNVRLIPQVHKYLNIK